MKQLAPAPTTDGTTTDQIAIGGPPTLPVSSPNVVALIPAYREQLHVGTVVQKALPYVDEVWVVDDGSPDYTAAHAKAAGAWVIRFESNQGKGAALKAGLLHLLARGARHIVMLDGDGQHDPTEIPRFVAATESDNVPFVIGNRLSGAGPMPIIRKLTNRCMSHHISRLTGVHIPDSQCGFRLLRSDIVSLVLGETSRFDFETEMILRATMAGCKITSVPVSTIYGNERSKINPFSDTFRFLRLMCKWRKLFKSVKTRTEKLPQAS